jgi:hypothetical protein
MGGNTENVDLRLKGMVAVVEIILVRLVSEVS